MNQSKPSIARNIPFFYISSFLSNFRLNAPILIIYLQQQTGSLTAAMSLLAFLMLGASLLDIPTGALADIVGRKMMIVLSWVFGFVHILLLAIGGSYGLLFLSMLAGSVGMALGSGANTALLYDSLIELNREEDYKKISGRANGLLTLALGVAAPLGSALASISFSLPFWIQLIPLFFGLLTTLPLVEPAYHKPLKSEVVIHSLRAAKTIFENRQLLFLLLITALSFALGETVATIIPKWYQMEIPLAWLGLAFTGAYVMSAPGFFFAHMISARFGDTPLLLFSTLSSIIGTIMATLLTGPFAIMLAVSISFFSGVRGPILDFLTNQQISSNQRATIGSFGGVIQRFFYAICAFMIGMLADRFGVISAIQLAMLLLTTNVVLLFLLKPRGAATLTRLPEVLLQGEPAGQDAASDTVHD
jgi:MFS family permease